MKFRRTTALLLVLACGFASVPGIARDLDQDEALRLRREGVIMPFEQLMQHIGNAYPGSSKRSWRKRMACWSMKSRF